MEHAAGGH